MQRQQLVNIHLIIAAVLLPAILMFAVTGGFYTWGIKGSYDVKSFNLPLATPLKGDLGSMVLFVQSELAKQNQALPSGGAKLKSNDHTHVLEWTGRQLDISLATDKGSKLAKLEVKHATLYRQLVQLHKAKSGQAFKVYAATIAIGLLVILLSGVLMGLSMPKYRKTTQISLIMGALIWLVMANVS